MGSDEMLFSTSRLMVFDRQLKWNYQSITTAGLGHVFYTVPVLELVN
jgi:hypothetical protein